MEYHPQFCDFSYFATFHKFDNLTRTKKTIYYFIIIVISYYYYYYSSVPNYEFTFTLNLVFLSIKYHIYLLKFILIGLKSKWTSNLG